MTHIGPALRDALNLFRSQHRGERAGRARISPTRYAELEREGRALQKKARAKQKVKGVLREGLIIVYFGSLVVPDKSLKGDAIACDALKDYE